MPKGTTTHASIQRLSAHDERRVAVAAGCDPRTVRHFLGGRATHSTTAGRITEAMKKLEMETTGTKIQAPDAEEPAPREEAAR